MSNFSRFEFIGNIIIIVMSQRNYDYRHTSHNAFFSLIVGKYLSACIYEMLKIWLKRKTIIIINIQLLFMFTMLRRNFISYFVSKNF